MVFERDVYGDRFGCRYWLRTCDGSAWVKSIIAVIYASGCLFFYGYYSTYCSEQGVSWESAQFAPWQGLSREAVGINACQESGAPPVLLYFIVYFVLLIVSLLSMFSTSCRLHRCSDRLYYAFTAGWFLLVILYIWNVIGLLSQFGKSANKDFGKVNTDFRNLSGFWLTIMLAADSFIFLDTAWDSADRQDLRADGSELEDWSKMEERIFYSRLIDVFRKQKRLQSGERGRLNYFNQRLEALNSRSEADDTFKPLMVSPLDH